MDNEIALLCREIINIVSAVIKSGCDEDAESSLMLLMLQHIKRRGWSASEIRDNAGYLFVFAKWRMMDLLRKKNFEASSYRKYVDAHSSDVAFTEQLSTKRIEIDEIFKHLSSDLVRIAKLKWMFGYSHKEIAADMGISQTTVTYRIGQIRKTLAKRKIWRP